MRSLLFGAPVLVGALFGDNQATCAGYFEEETDYHTGQDLGPVDAGDQYECCQKCGETSGCNYFTFSTTSQTSNCWLKRHKAGIRKRSGAISGSIHAMTSRTTTTTTPHPDPLPAAPPTPPPAVTEPVKVHILLGQSNMVGLGAIEGWKDGTLENAVQKKGLYQYLVEDGHWKALDHMRNVFIMGSGDSAFEKSTLQHNEWMTVDYSKKKTIGPELGIGFTMANFTQNHPTMMLKSCIGNRALGWDLLPPDSQRWNYTDGNGKEWTYAGFGDAPMKVEKGTPFSGEGWTAGLQWTGDTIRAHKILADLDTYYPGGNGVSYEIAGFFWWQGTKDSVDDGLSERYEYNLVNFIKAIRKEFNAPTAKFVTASLGQTPMGATDNGGKILDAMLAVDGKSGKYPEFGGNVAAVYTHPLSRGGSSGAHYGGNAETYMNVGEAMGAAMAELLKGSSDISV